MKLSEFGSLTSSGIALLWDKILRQQREIDKLKAQIEMHDKALQRVSNFMQIVEARREAELERTKK